jgi:hypothetical protein
MANFTVSLHNTTIWTIGIAGKSISNHACHCGFFLCSLIFQIMSWITEQMSYHACIGLMKISLGGSILTHRTGSRSPTRCIIMTTDITTATICHLLWEFWYLPRRRNRSHNR